jgi:hypothetical protein
MSTLLLRMIPERPGEGQRVSVGNKEQRPLPVPHVFRASLQSERVPSRC